MLEPGAADVWSEHSERKVLASLAAARGIGRERRAHLGRWAEAEGRGERPYIQAHANIVTDIQTELMGSWSYLASWYGEGDAHERITEKMGGRINAGALD